MSSFLAQRQPNELFAFQKQGNHNNWKYSITIAPSDSVLPFNFKIVDGVTITIFEARGVSIINDVVTVLETIDLFPLVPIIQSGDNYTITGNGTIPTALDVGIYYYHFSDGDQVTESDLFYVDGSVYYFSNWILATGFWRDTGVWINTEYWND